MNALSGYNYEFSAGQRIEIPSEWADTDLVVCFDDTGEQDIGLDPFLDEAGAESEDTQTDILWTTIREKDREEPLSIFKAQSARRGVVSLTRGDLKPTVIQFTAANSNEINIPL